MTVRLSPELVQYVQNKVEQGEFESEDAVVSEAMRLYRTLEARYQRLCGDVKEAIDQINRGEGIELVGDPELQAFFEGVKSRGRKGRSNEV